MGENRGSIISVARVEEFIRRAHPSKAIYGQIIAASLLAALEERGSTPWEAIVSISVTVMAVWLAKLYADLLGKSVQRQTMPPTDRKQIVVETLAVLLSLIPMCSIFAVAAAGLIPLRAAFRLAEAVTLVILFVMGFESMRRYKDSIWRGIGAGILAALVGAAIIGLKSALH